VILYLHGFASGPGSTKARAVAEGLASDGLEVVRADLTPGPEGFERSTPSSMLATRHAAPAAVLTLNTLPLRRCCSASATSGWAPAGNSVGTAGACASAPAVAVSRPSAVMDRDSIVISAS